MSTVVYDSNNDRPLFPTAPPVFPTAAPNNDRQLFPTAPPAFPTAAPVSTVYDSNKDRQLFPTAAPAAVGVGEMGNLDLGSKYDGMSMTFAKVSMGCFEKDSYGKDKASLDLYVEDIKALNQLAGDLEQYLKTTFKDQNWVVRSPHFHGTIKLGWPTHKKALADIVCHDIVPGKDKTVGMDGFNQLIGFNHLMPASATVKTKLWLRGDDDDGKLVHTVGFYYTLDSLRFP